MERPRNSRQNQNPLSEGSLDKLMHGIQVECPLRLQVVSVKHSLHVSNTDTTNNRYELKISDGKTVCTFVGIFSTLNQLIRSKNMGQFSVIEVNRYNMRKTQRNGEDRYIIALMKLDILVPGYHVNRIIGNIDMSLLEEKMEHIGLQE